MYFGVKDDSVEATAAAWVIRLDSGELTDAERSELDAWVARDPQHAGALLRAQMIWADADRVAALDIGRTNTNTPRPEPKVPSLGRMPRFARQSLAAGLALVLVAGALLAFAGLWGRETSRFGEIRRITLNDGSNIVLNASSTVQVNLKKDERLVKLLQGEASFNVAHDVERPFIVQAGNVAIKAVGTSFSVDMQAANAVSVTVVEGVVEVTRRNESGGQEVKVLGHNRELLAKTARPMTAAEVTDREVSRQLAWQEGLLEFDGERLSEAVTRVNRYSRTPVVIDSEALAQRKFVGVFRVGDARAFADAAATAFDGHVEKRNDGFHLTQ